MNPSNGAAPATPGVREQVATRIVFFIAGLTMSSWAPLIPHARSRLGMDDGQLGLMLLCLGIGSVLMMPVSGGLAARFGCRRVLATSGLIICTALPFLVLASTPWALAATLLVIGAGMGVFDVVMNIQAVIVERASGRAMMSGFHGLYSVGGIGGAGGVSAMMALGASPLQAVLATTALGGVLLATSLRALLPHGGEADHPAFAIPRGRVLLIGAVCFAMFLAEGAVLDWSAVFLTTVRRVDLATAGFGYVAFAIAMTAGRLAGDRIVHALGPRRVVLAGALLAAAGFALAVMAPAWQLGLVGFALVGAGAANVVPVMFSAAGRQHSMPTHLAIAAVTTMGYAGVLLGPALLGLLADVWSLPHALGALAVLLVIVAMLSRRVTRD